MTQDPFSYWNNTVTRKWLGLENHSNCREWMTSESLNQWLVNNSGQYPNYIIVSRPNIWNRAKWEKLSNYENGNFERAEWKISFEYFLVNWHWSCNFELNLNRNKYITMHVNQLPDNWTILMESCALELKIINCVVN